jgi:hypothetical protein
MILGIGIDILSISRFEALIQRRGALNLAKRICTDTEYKDFECLPNGNSPVNNVQTRYLSSRLVASVYLPPPYLQVGGADREQMDTEGSSIQITFSP